MKPSIIATVLPNGNLRIDANDSYREGPLAKASDIYEALEPLIEQSEYEWCRPEWAGALTDAPMLAIFGEERPLPEGVTAADLHWLKTTWSGPDVAECRYVPVEACWGYMDYALRDPLDELRDTGSCIWISGE